jgi:hypothetical protein
MSSEAKVITPYSKPSPFAGHLIKRARLAYYQYEVTLPLYVMTPGERLVFNTFMAMVLSLLTLGTIIYLPSLIVRASHRMIWLYDGVDHKVHMEF